MPTPQDGAAAPIADKHALIAYMQAGCKPADAWRIGTEHEKFAYDLKTLRPLAYEGAPGIRALLEALQRFGWEPVLEAGNPVG